MSDILPKIGLPCMTLSYIYTSYRQYSQTLLLIQKKLKNIHWKYLFSHWTSTLLIAPFVVQLLMYLTRSNTHQIVGLVEVYPITLIFSLIFSFPTYLILAFTDYFCFKNGLPKKHVKTVLITIALLGIIITFYCIYRTRDFEMTVGYFLTSLITGIILKLK